jgi:hypothetical protein
MTSEHPLPDALETLCRITVERLRMGRVSRATVSHMAAEIEHTAIWAGQHTLTTPVTLLDLMACSRRLSTMAGTAEETG